MSARYSPAALAIITDARIEAVLADAEGIPLRDLPDLLKLAYVELICLLAELEAPTPHGIAERRDNVVRLVTDMMRAGQSA